MSGSDEQPIDANYLKDLNALLDSSGAGWKLDSAYAINDSGEIVGRGYYSGSGNVERAFLLTIVPEVATGTAVAVGLAGLVLGRRKRRPSRG